MKWRFWLPQNSFPSVSCAAIEPLLSLYSDGMASASETRLVESHLSACHDCQRALSWMQATQSVISKRPMVLPPPDLRARIAQSIAESEHTTRPVRSAPRPFVLGPVYLTAAVAVTLTAFGVLITDLQPASKQVVTHPTLTARSTAPAVPSGISAIPAKGLVERGRPEKRSHVATLPPRVMAVIRPIKWHPIATERVAKTLMPGGSASTTGDDTAVRGIGPSTVTQPRRPVQLAEKPMDKPRLVSPPLRKSFVVAAKLPKTLPSANAEFDSVTSSPELAAPSPETVENVHPAVAQVTVAIPAAKSPAREGVLSLARLATYRTTNADLKVYRNSNTRVQTAAFSSEPKFVQAAINYTPTALTGSAPSHDH